MISKILVFGISNLIKVELRFAVSYGGDFTFIFNLIKDRSSVVVREIRKLVYHEMLCNASDFSYVSVCFIIINRYRNSVNEDNVIDGVINYYAMNEELVSARRKRQKESKAMRGD